MKNKLKRIGWVPFCTKGEHCGAWHDTIYEKKEECSYAISRFWDPERFKIVAIYAEKPK